MTRALSCRVIILYLLYAIFPQLRMLVQIKEVRVILIIKTIWFSRKLSRRAIAKLYNVLETTLRNKINDVISKNNSQLDVQLLIKIKKDMIVQYILDLDSRGFSSLINDVRKIINYILESRDLRCVEQQWLYRFI